MESETVSVVMNKEEEDIVQLLLPPHLDENIITQILLKIPAETLFNTFRYVCKSWLKIISTHPCIHLNRLIPSKPPCLITQTSDYGESPKGRLTTCFSTLTKEGMIEEQFDDDLINPLFRNLYIKSCCNGLILALAATGEPFYDVNVYVVNPLTNYRLRLPCPPQYEKFGYADFKLLFIPSTGEYKVVLVTNQNNCIQILTLSAGDCYGSNDRLLQWRIIKAPYEIHTSRSITARNFMVYWGTIIGYCKGMHIISFDASVEKFHETTYHSYPPCHESDSRKGKMRLREKIVISEQVDMGLIEMGGLLSCWSLRPAKGDPDSVTRLSVNVVKNFHEGEWIEKYSIEIDTKFGGPVLSFGNGEVLIFDNLRKNNTMWALNVKLNQWWKVQEKSSLCSSSFYGFHNNNKPVPLESIFAIESGTFKREEEDSRK